MNGHHPIALHIFTCGGTIDKVYFDSHSNYQVGQPQIESILQRLRVETNVHVESLLRKDSLDIDDSDRQYIRDRVQRCEGQRILITHGTDQMPRTAMALQGLGSKTIVLTGANTPARFIDSDAEFNVGFALAATMLLPAGVYIAMNGCIYPGDRVRKNRAAGRFDWIED